MNTAMVRIDEKTLFDALGLKNLNAQIVFVRGLPNRLLEIGIAGYDERLINEPNYPQCHIICQHIESHCEKVEK